MNELTVEANMTLIIIVLIGVVVVAGLLIVRYFLSVINGAYNG